jgi:hypothetical protein
MLSETQISDFWECYEAGASSYEEIAKYVSEVCGMEYETIFKEVKEYGKDNLTWSLPLSIVE